MDQTIVAAQQNFLSGIKLARLEDLASRAYSRVVRRNTRHGETALLTIEASATYLLLEGMVRDEFGNLTGQTDHRHRVTECFHPIPYFDCE